MLFLSCHRGLSKEQEVLLTHGDSLGSVGEGFKVAATSGNIIAGENITVFKREFIVIIAILANNVVCIVSTWWFKDVWEPNCTHVCVLQKTERYHWHGIETTNKQTKQI